jgi:hypothetical protein
MYVCVGVSVGVGVCVCQNAEMLWIPNMMIMTYFIPAQACIWKLYIKGTAVTPQGKKQYLCRVM